MGRGAKAGKKSPRQKADSTFRREWSQLEKEVSREYQRTLLPIAITEAFVLLMNIAPIVMHDYYGFGKKRMGDVAEHLLDYFEAMQKRDVTIDEIIEETQRLTGLRYALTRDEVETLQALQLRGLASEIRMNDAAHRWMHDRRERGWKSSTNRYGEEIK